MSEFHHHNPRERIEARVQRQQENFFALLAGDHSRWQYPLGSTSTFAEYVMNNQTFYTTPRNQSPNGLSECWQAWFPLFLDKLYFNKHVSGVYDIFGTCPFTSCSFLGDITPTEVLYFQ